MNLKTQWICGSATLAAMALLVACLANPQSSVRRIQHMQSKFPYLGNAALRADSKYLFLHRLTGLNGLIHYKKWPSVAS